MRPPLLVLALVGLVAAALPAPAAASPAAVPCAPIAAAHRPAADEWGGCLRVSLRLDAAPAVGTESTLRIQVDASAGRTAQLDVELPANLAWTTPPAGLSPRAAASAAPEDRGHVTRATTTVPVTPGSPAVLTGRVTALAPGAAQIRAHAVSSAAFPDVSADSLHVTVGGATVAGDTDRAVPTDAPAVRAFDRLAFKPAGPAGAASAAADTCAAGTWRYVDHTGVTRPAGNITVSAYDRDATGGDDLLGTVLTDVVGGFSVCFANNIDEEGGGQDLYLRFATTNAHWVVQHTTTKQPFAFDTDVFSNVATGGTTQFGARQPGDPALMRGIEAFDQVGAGWNWTPGDCWDARDTVCRQGRLNWAPNSTDGTYYVLAENAVHLAADDPKAPNLVLHEWGHYMMDDAYEDAFPNAPKCSPHYIPRKSSRGCAWTEGFATWFAVVVLDDPYFRWPNGASLNVENPTWGTPDWDNGDWVEGRVLGAMLDLVDTTNEGTDQCAEDEKGPLWNTFLGHTSATFSAFWQHRGQDGHDVSNTALGCVHQNTINYGYQP